MLLIGAWGQCIAWHILHLERLVHDVYTYKEDGSPGLNLLHRGA